MPLNDTEIKTRLGLILQRVLAEALRGSGFTFAENFQYDEDCEKPDFLIPNGLNPTHMIEVHQTDARDSFRMKILRGFTAVTESKVHFGKDLISVNILFGDPRTELPASNVRALEGYFDANFIPRYHSEYGDDLTELQAKALQLARNENIDTTEAADEIINNMTIQVKCLGDAVKELLDSANPNPALYGLWESENQRAVNRGVAPTAGAFTYYKRGILQSLFLSDEHFAELLGKQDPNKCSAESQSQLRATKLVREISTMAGIKLEIDKPLQFFIRGDQTTSLRELASSRIQNETLLAQYFEDIRNPARRTAMTERVLELVLLGKNALRGGLLECLQTGSYGGITHQRCWIADILPAIVDESHNTFNRRMFGHPNYTQSIGNPYNNITIRSPRLGSDLTDLSEYVDVAVEIFFDIALEKEINVRDLSLMDIANKLLTLRMDAAIKLQKLNPLYVAIEDFARGLLLEINYGGTQSFLSDLSNPSDPVGKYDLYHITDGNKTLLANAIAVHDNNGDHKSKEWGARRKSTLYRLRDGNVVRSEYPDALFVLDGEWRQKDINRLYASGWNHVIYLNQLEAFLKGFFNK